MCICTWASSNATHLRQSAPARGLSPTAPNARSKTLPKRVESSARSVHTTRKFSIQRSPSNRRPRHTAATGSCLPRVKQAELELDCVGEGCGPGCWCQRNRAGLPWSVCLEKHGTAQPRRVRRAFSLPLVHRETCAAHPISFRETARGAFPSNFKRSPHTPPRVLDPLAPLRIAVAAAAAAVFADPLPPRSVPACSLLHRLSRKDFPELEAERSRRDRALEHRTGPPRFGRQQLFFLAVAPLAPRLAATNTGCGGRRGDSGLLGRGVCGGRGRVPSCQVGVLVCVYVQEKGSRPDADGGGGRRGCAKEGKGAARRRAGDRKKEAFVGDATVAACRRDRKTVRRGSWLFERPPSPLLVAQRGSEPPTKVRGHRR